MTMILTDEHRMLRDAARDFFTARAPVDHMRALRSQNGHPGYDKDLWADMAAMGWAGIVIPEEYGGLGFGYTGLGLVLEEAGRTLAPSPLESTALIGATILTHLGTPAQKSDLLPQIAEGRHLTALALDEGPHHAPSGAAVEAKKKGKGYVLNGTKRFVMDGSIADTLIVSVRTKGQPGDAQGISLVLVPRTAPGVTVTPQTMVDFRNAAEVRFDSVAVDAGSVMEADGNAFEGLEACLDRIRIGLSAQMQGLAQEAFDRTLAYLKERTQFGTVIGRFQALQHRAAAMYCELELARSVTLEALGAVDRGSNRLPLLASLAKARLSDVVHLVTREAIQLHGGIGVTDEHDIGLFFKRGAVLEAAFGSARFHRNRYAVLEGY